MSLARHLPACLLALGGATAAVALVWWGLTFWPTVSNEYLSVAEAGRCLVADSSLCRLASSLCGARHATLVAAYTPVVFWIGAAVACSGLWPHRHRATVDRRPGDADEDAALDAAPGRDAAAS